ncbi:MAG TPA: hypothetical protein VNI52_13425 [Sphingobacteriaceae bacterium]|nr:hypothetical protein [Sphingobacteriaceae bacterium]
MESSRRQFIKKTGYAALAAGFFSHVPAELYSIGKSYKREDLQLYNNLLQEWCNGMISVQGKDKSNPATYGGFMCPSCGFIHGRCGEAAFPLLYMADQTKDQRYLDAALQVYNWGDRNVSRNDGSWGNEIAPNSWKGITVFGGSALCESLKYHSHLLDSNTREQWMARLRKACDFLYDFITVETSNINYPLCASYPLGLGGKLLKEQKFIDRAHELAHTVYQYLTPQSNFIYGELKPRTRSSRGYWPVDLSYNVEETLPTLTLYALEMGDGKLLNTIIDSWKTHLEFMLPDGAWDDSFGTRNHKWTYWGSRNSDGCQAGLALLGNKVPLFAEGAYRNALMLEKCTYKGMLYGGPHYVSHGVKPCIHHNFAHAKSLASLLNEKDHVGDKFTRTKLPTEKMQGIKTFTDIGTHLIKVGKWRATVTANDTEYRVSPHASGGCISLLYHQDMGLLLTDSLFPELPPRERANMQKNDDSLQLLLTPRIEMMVGGFPYRSSRDINAIVTSKPIPNGVHLNVQCKLVSLNVEDAPGGAANFELDYFFTDSGVEIRAIAKNVPVNQGIAFYLPVVSPNSEKLSLTSAQSMTVNKEKGKLKIKTSGKLNIIPSDKNRVFSQSPGVEAIPLKIDWDVEATAELKISITA